MFINQPSLQNAFDQAYEKYSPQLRNLVDKTDGPILAFLHSPTNIPRLFSVRIARILSASKTLPENIICLTQTETSVHSVKTELAHLIPDDAARPNIHTIHSFCEMVMESYVSKFNYTHPKLISTLETVQLLKELIAAFPTNHPLKRYRADVYHEIKNLKKLFAIVKQEGFTTEYIHQQIDAFRNELLESEAPQTDFKNLPLDEAIGMINKLSAGIDEFNHWQKLLQKYNRYDADDLIPMTIKTLEEDEKLLSIYQHQFQYIQAEEQAFSNKPAQKLLELLLGENKHPNIFLTNYEYEPVNGSHHPNIKSDLVFDWIEIKAKPEINHLQAASLLYLPIITSYQSDEAALAGVANNALTLLQENVAPARIAIAITDDGYNKKSAQIFTVKSLPFYGKRTVDILQEPFIKKIIQILRYISTEIEIPFSGDELLFEILHFDFCPVPLIEIAKLSVEVNSKKYSSSPTAIRKLLQERANAPAKDLFDLGMDKELKAVSAILEKLIQDALHLNPESLLENILQNARVLTYANKSDDRIWLMQLLNAWTGFIQKETAQNPGLQLNQLIAALDTLQAEGFPISIIHQTDIADGIQIIQPEEGWTGELDYLFILDVNELMPEKNEWVDWMEQFSRATANSPHDLRANNRHRLLNHLLFAVPNGSVSFSKYNTKGIECLPTGFTAEILSQHSLPVIEAAELKLERTLLRPKIASLEASFVAPIVNKFIMNVSALNSYLKCPLGFYYKNILRIPNGKSEALEFGSAIHYALEQLFKKMAAGYDSTAANTTRKDEFPSVTEMIGDFKLYLFRQRTNFTREAFERRMAYGEEVLKNYYAQYISSWNKVVSIERNIRGVTVNGVPLKGKLDKLEFNGNDVIIVDYKSGNIGKALLKINPPNENEPNGGDYWRQAVFYKILVDHYKSKAWKVTGVEFDFIEPDKSRQYRKVKIEINAPDIETVTQQLTATWHKIQSHDFYTGCGRQDCHWCNLVKDNRLAVAMIE